MTETCEPALEDNQASCNVVFAYHERTKHHFHRYARSLGYMDWANQPNPFRYYEGAMQSKLDVHRKPRPLPYDRLYENAALPPQPLDLNSLADFFRYSLVRLLHFFRSRKAANTALKNVQIIGLTRRQWERRRLLHLRPPQRCENG